MFQIKRLQNTTIWIPWEIFGVTERRKLEWMTLIRMISTTFSALQYIAEFGVNFCHENCCFEMRKCRIYKNWMCWINWCIVVLGQIYLFQNHRNFCYSILSHEIDWEWSYSFIKLYSFNLNFIQNIISINLNFRMHLKLSSQWKRWLKWFIELRRKSEHHWAWFSIPKRRIRPNLL